MINEIKNKPSFPRDASSIIIIKRKKNQLYVLMGKRSAKSRFMPSIYVFPGGAVERDDYKVNNIFNLSTNIKKSLLKSRSNKHTVAIMLSAIRETAEECGLFLVSHKMKTKYKKLVLNETWNYFLEKSILPSTHKLFYFGRAITPSYLKTRYHARFFIAQLNDFCGKIRTNGELENIDWIELKKAKLLPIADVTEFLINRIIHLNNFKSLLEKQNKYPMFTRRNKKQWIKWDE